ncbi:DUF2382 domain-containing protein [Nocardiopsis trehalosi]|jgi:uncharacterized protein (TIGR02271 family)|uniref:DUF2382 domain-containing protein n=1 Tax=Nocardiopsis trehalosi TaxID=109329 RepID=UPI000833B5A7|nr:PRC and DUF2382 domain-containing protein [Nocardiopsis trehalosi]
MAPQRAAQEFIGHKLLDREGHNVGRIEQVYFDDRTDAPKWAAVQTGMFGAKHSLVPLQGSRATEDDLMVPFDKDTIKDAPRIDADDHLSMDDEDTLYRHYGVTVPGQRAAETGPTGEAAGRAAAGPAAAGAPGTAGRAGTEDRAGGPAGAEDDITMVRSEEQAHIGVESRESGHARVRKTVDSEHFEQDVPVTHEELHVERVPLTEQDRDAAAAGRIGEEDETEVTLYAEQAVVAKESVPVEKVRISKEEVTENQHVQGELRKERVEVERDTDAPDDRRRPPAG